MLTDSHLIRPTKFIFQRAGPCAHRRMVTEQHATATHAAALELHVRGGYELCDEKISVNPEWHVLLAVACGVAGKLLDSQVLGRGVSACTAQFFEEVGSVANRTMRR